MLLASRIACRNEPEPLSLVFVTVKTKGVVTLFTRIGSSLVERVVLNALATSAALPPDICAFGDSTAIVFRRSRSTLPPSKVERVVLNALAKLDASQIEQIDNKVIASATRSTKACGEVFFFISFSGVEIPGCGRCTTFFYGEASQIFPEKCVGYRLTKYNAAANEH